MEIRVWIPVQQSNKPSQERESVHTNTPARSPHTYRTPSSFTSPHTNSPTSSSTASASKHDEPAPYHHRTITMRPTVVSRLQFYRRAAYMDVRSRPTLHDSHQAHTPSRTGWSAKSLLHSLATALHLWRRVRERDLMPIDLSLVVQVPQLPTGNHSLSYLTLRGNRRMDLNYFVTHFPHCFAGGYVYSSNAVVDLLSRGQPPTLSEESGEVRPRRESSFWQVSESDLGGRSQQTLSVPLGNSTVALTAARPWRLLRGTHGRSGGAAARPFVVTRMFDPRARVDALETHKENVSVRPG